MVYRPPKKKALPAGPGASFPANRPDADPLEGPLQGPLKPGDPRQGDDRNLVLVDQDFSDADFEDRVWLFWQKRRVLVLWAVTLALAAVAGWQGWLFYQRQQTAALQADYLTAQIAGAQALLEFGRAHTGAPLGRAALLEAADTLYKNAATPAAFSEAAAAYADAAAAWGNTPYGERARLGAGMALAQTGDATLAAARRQLEALAGDTNGTATFRGQAIYFLVVLALQSGDVEGARTWSQKFQSVPAPQWSSLSTQLIELAPRMPKGPPAGALPPGATPSNVLGAAPSPMGGLPPGLQIPSSLSGSPATAAPASPTPAPSPQAATPASVPPDAAVTPPVAPPAAN